MRMMTTSLGIVRRVLACRGDASARRFSLRRGSRPKALFAGAATVLGAVVFGLGAGVASAGPRGVANAGPSPNSSSLNTTAQCLVDDGTQFSSEPFEAPEFATIKIHPTGLNGGNGKLRQVPISMTFTDDEADTASVTVLSISGNVADSSGVGNSATGPADGTEINTALKLRATPGNTYTITVQCAEGGTPPASQNQVSFQVTVPN